MQVLRAPVTVPNEIIARIFSFAMDNLPSDSSMQTATAIGQVCKRWRRLLYSTPSLWSRLSIEFVDINDGTMYGVQKITSIRGLGLCLSQSHPAPLRINFCVKPRTLDSSLRSALDDFDDDIQTAMYMLRAHSIRWKRVSFTGTSWTMELLHSLHHLQSSRALESLTLRAFDIQQPWYAEEQPVALTSCLKHLDINFHIPNLQPDWSSLISLSMGFQDVDSCHHVLAQAANLEALTLIHIGSSTTGSPLKKLTMSGVRRLNLTACAAYNLFDGLSVPCLVELGLILPNDDSQEHSAHRDPEIKECRETFPVAEATKHVVSILEKSGVRLKSFTAAWATSYESIASILALAQDASVLSLNLEMPRDKYILDNMVYTKPPLFPSLCELRLCFDTNSDPDDLIASFDTLEELVCVRQASGSLRKFTLERTFVPGEDQGEDLTPQVYAASSLAQTLYRMWRAEDLEVRWIVGPGDFDIMDYAAMYQVPFF